MVLRARAPVPAALVASLLFLTWVRHGANLKTLQGGHGRGMVGYPRHRRVPVVLEPASGPTPSALQVTGASKARSGQTPVLVVVGIHAGGAKRTVLLFRHGAGWAGSND